jgi:biotin carboxyl carrier protein
MAGRQSAQALARQLLRQTHGTRAFSSIPHRLAAQNFTMPAMSPTMTEGNIASWKVKEGDSFSTGDILLEIETDKATIDVEAQDDGVMAKIFEQDGAKGIRVGSRIAVIGEAGDDPSSLEIPADDSKPIESESKQESKPSVTEQQEEKKPTQQPSKAKRADTSEKAPSGPGQNPKYPLYPSVIALLHESHISDSEISKIPATGPNNRLLKGDVLAYLGSISASYPQEQSKRISHLAHLDLSNIKILQQTPKASRETGTQPDAPTAPATASISLPISLAEVLKVQKKLQDTLGTTIPLSTFLSRAVDLANDDLPRSKATPPSADELFNAVLGLENVPCTSRGAYLPQITALSPNSFTRQPTSLRSRPSKPDIIDILAGKPGLLSRQSARNLSTGGSVTSAGGAINLFSLTVPVGEEKRARTFLERVKTVLQVEPGRLVL